MSLRYGSVCSGIEAASVAWHPLGFVPVFFSEIEKFPSRVLAHHYGSNMPGDEHAKNGVPNYGDMTKFQDWPDAAIDVLAGGTPCQSFSIAGLRAGLDDPRGNLALVYGALARRYRPRWLVWENVPGVLSSSAGRDFASLLGLLTGQRIEPPPGGWKNAGAIAGIGSAYGIAWRVLDSQYVRVDGHARAVPQRRRRVFVVGYSGGDWRRAAAVLFEPESLRGDSAPRREAGQSVAPTIAARTRGGGGLGTDFDCSGRLIAIGGGPDGGPISGTVSSKWAKGTGGPAGDEAYNLVAHALRAEGFDASEDGTGRGTPLVPIAFPEFMGSTAHAAAENLSPALGAKNPTAVAYDMRGREGGAQFEGPHHTANIRAANGGSSRSYIQQNWAVRRLTPRECERLQGFPDDYTLIEKSSDGARYKALGNSMAVNVMRWIGMRLQIADAAFKDLDNRGKAA